MNLFSRLSIALLGFAIASSCMLGSASAQDAARCISPAESVKPEGTAPGMRVQLISNGPGAKQYAVIFSTGDEAYSGLLQFAQQFQQREFQEYSEQRGEGRFVNGPVILQWGKNHPHGKAAGLLKKVGPPPGFPGLPFDDEGAQGGYDQRS